MSERTIGIERLEVRLNGVSPDLARAVVGDFGSELLGQLAGRHGHAQTGRIERLNAGTVSLTSPATPSGLRRAIAGRVADAVISTPRNG